MARKLRDLMESLPPERRAEIEKRSAEIRREIEAREKAVGLFCLKHEYVFPEGAPHSCPHCEMEAKMELIPGQPCPYCGEGSMIHHATGIGSYCSNGFECKQQIPWNHASNEVDHEVIERCAAIADKHGAECMHGDGWIIAEQIAREIRDLKK